MEQNERAAFSLAHEPGYVFGLDHEHQRSDATDEVIINCAALAGFAIARANVAQAVHPEFMINESGDDRMKKVCTRPDLAAIYVPTLLSLPPFEREGDFHPGYRSPLIYMEESHGPLFDHKSIMMYGSAHFAESYNLDNRSTWTLISRYDRYPEWGPRYAGIVAEGGNTNVRDASISPGRHTENRSPLPERRPATRQPEARWRQQHRERNDQCHSHT